MTAMEIREKILNDHPKWAMRAIVAIYNRQTADEQNCGITKHQNGVGFSGSDCEFGTSIAKQILSGRQLSIKQIQIVRKVASKYSRQLSQIAQLQK